MKAAIYARVSRPDEAAILDNEVRSAEEYVAAKGWELWWVYKEIASGLPEKQAQLSQLRKDAHRGRFGVVVFTSLSRMTRGGIEAALYILKDLERAGVGWHFVEQPVLNYDAGTDKMARDIVLAVLAAVDEDYRRRIREATRAAYARHKALADARGDKVRWGRPKKATPDDHGGEPTSGNGGDSSE
jgi:DNA invertase Pin-like site-specific DNA recombinase